MAEFIRLQKLQSAQVPSPRAVGVLMGFKIDARDGDAVIIEAIEPAVQLDHYLNEFLLRGEPIPNHLALAQKLRQVVGQLARARLGHEDLHLGNFLLRDGELFLLDGYAVRLDGLAVSDLLHLGHSVSRFATRMDLLRGWFELGPKRPPPTSNPAAELEWRNFIRRRVKGDNAYFGRVSHEDWSGSFFKADKHPRRWSAASQLKITREDWERELPPLLDKIARDELTVIKRSAGGDVLATTLTLGGKSIDVIIKRPRHRYWFRHVTGLWRRTRARREWFKAWKMIVRNVPTAWPLLYMEKFRSGYATDGLIIFERIEGPMLVWLKLDQLDSHDRDMVLRRAGRILRRIDRLGFAHFDAKARHWIVRMDDSLGPFPMLIDIDGIRHRRWTALGIRRLLKSMQENEQYVPADSLSLCQGYAPIGKLIQPEKSEEVDA